MGHNISCGIHKNNSSHKGTIIKTAFQIEQTQKMSDIMTTFFISSQELAKLYSFFNKIDSTKSGFITLSQIYILVSESPNKSNMSPFIDHLFNIVDKKYNSQITFEEFLPYLISFCISSTYQLIEFVFNMIDTDHNKLISIEQIDDLLRRKKGEYELFLINHAKRLKDYSSMKIIRSDKLSIDDFVTLCSDLPFVYYPVVKLQKKLRKNYISESFWSKMEKNIRNKYIESLSKKEDLKLQVNIEDIRNKVIAERIKNFKKRWENEQKEKLNREIYKEQIRLSIPRKNSDTEYFIDKYRNKKDADEIQSVDNIDIHIKITFSD